MTVRLRPVSYTHLDVYKRQILFSAGTNVIRFVPPLVITKADVDECIAKLKKSF